MKHRNVQHLAQAPLDLKTARRRDVLEIDPAKHRRDRLYDQDDLLDILRVQAQRESIHAGELLEQDRLALHHRQRATRPDVTQPQNSRAIRHHRHRVALDRQVPNRLRVARDRPRNARNTRRIRHRKIVTRLQRHARMHLQLAAQMNQERAIRDRLNLDALDRIHRRHDTLDMRLVLSQDRDVANLVPALDADQIDRPQRRVLLPDHRRDPREASGRIGQPNPQNRAKRRRNVRHADQPTPATTSAARGFLVDRRAPEA